MLCAHFIADQPCCARGVNYQALAGGGVFTLIMRLPCVEISNRRGEEARACQQFEQQKTETV
jgi:hypothetical protein